MVDDEVWRPVVGFEGFYEVSSHGRVRSLDRTETIRNRWGPMTRVKRGRILKPVVDSRGYVRADLRRPGARPRHYLVHRLVLEAFVGACPGDKPLGLHADDVPTNNHVGNLRWGNEADNAHDSVRNGTHYNRRMKEARNG